MATIRDVAEEANVSVATVSRYLNNKGYVGLDTKRKLNLAIQKLNYVPNEIARSLNKQASKIIGLIIPDLSNPYFPVIIRGAEMCAKEHGYMLILGNTEGQISTGAQFINFFQQYNISGLIKLDGDLVDIPKHIYTVAIDRIQENDCFAVVTDDYCGGQLAADAIINTQYNKVLVMSGPSHLKVAQERLSGIKMVFEHHDVDYQIYETLSYQNEFAEETAQKVLAKFPDVDTIIASNDIYALALIKEAQIRGYNVPKDIQVMGYDGIVFGEYSHPALTTIHQPAFDIGYQGVKLLIRRLNQDDTLSSHEILKLKPNILERHSLRRF